MSFDGIFKFWKQNAKIRSHFKFLRVELANFILVNSSSSSASASRASSSAVFFFRISGLSGCSGGGSWTTSFFFILYCHKNLKTSSISNYVALFTYFEEENFQFRYPTVKNSFFKSNYKNVLTLYCTRHYSAMRLLRDPTRLYALSATLSAVNRDCFFKRFSSFLVLPFSCHLIE